jgi:glutamine synthetase
VNIEGETTAQMAQTQILPSAFSYLAELGEVEVESRALTRITEQVAKAADELSDALEHLRIQNAELGGEHIHEKAHHMRDNVLPAMLEVRKAADELEKLVSDKLWPLPSYQEMVFVK